MATKTLFPSLPGKLIALEGIDGAGTSSQMQPLQACLRGQGHQVLVTHQPSDGPIGRLARAGLRDERLTASSLALLFAADRLQHLAETMVPALQQGAVVLVDRYLWSSYAYQSLNLPLSFVRQINQLARPPDLVLYFQVQIATAEQRRQQRQHQPERFESNPLLAQVAQNYEALCRSETVAWRRIDAEVDMEQVSAQLQQVISQFLGNP